MPDANYSSSSGRKDRESSSPRGDDWSMVTDPNERRKIQNRIAQRKFREKVKQQREADERREEIERRAGAAYTSPNPREMSSRNESGLPWGSISLKHVIQTGQSRNYQSTSNQMRSNYGARDGGSSRMGLHLADQYARGMPAWMAWRNQLPANYIRDSYMNDSIDSDSRHSER